MPVAFNHLQHVGIPVTDITRSTSFYEGLGFENVMSSSFDIASGTGRVAMMQRGQAILELYEMPAPDLAEIRRRGNGHIDHVAFDVDNIDATFDQLKREGYSLQEAEPVFLPKFWKAGCRYFNILGPDGERLEFNQIL